MEMSKKIIHNQQAEIHTQLETLLKLDMENQMLLGENLKLEEHSNRWYKNPIVIGVLGFATGVVVIELAR